MKVKWRADERLLITGFVFLSVISFIVKVFDRRQEPYDAQHYLLPQAGSLLLLFGAYLWLNLLIIPMTVEAVTSIAGRWRRITSVCFEVLLLVYMLGPVVNYISFYAGPHYHGFQEFPLTFGFHPQPLLNGVGGMGFAFFLLCVYGLYILVREVLIYRLEVRAARETYWIHVCNQVTTFGVIFAPPFVTALFHLAGDASFYNYYFAWASPAVLIFLTNNYWLFPLNEGKPFFRVKFMWPLLWLSFGYAIIFGICLKENWTLPMLLATWAMLVLVVTPMSWLTYHQGKNNILKLKAAEKSLVHSKADLQLLRSQINPHFLFNALMVFTTSLIEESPDTAQGILQLSDMRRFMLHDNQE